VIPVVIAANGTISKSLKQYLSKYHESTKLRDHKKSHIGHCTHATESANVLVQKKMGTINHN
jgi:hypothetical protein